MDTLFFNLFNFSYRFLQRARKQHAQSKCTSKQYTQKKYTPNFGIQSSTFKILQCTLNYLEMSAFHRKNCLWIWWSIPWCSYDAFRGATKLTCSSISKLISLISDISIDISFIPTNSYRNHWYGFRFRSFSKLPCFGDLKRCRLQSNWNPN